MLVNINQDLITSKQLFDQLILLLDVNNICLEAFPLNSIMHDKNLSLIDGK